MDAFWVIPTGILTLGFLSLFYAYIRKCPQPPSTPRVLVDKKGGPPVDPAIEARDWSSRPCGSFLDWLSGNGRK